jgi:hypothetical protein
MLLSLRSMYAAIMTQPQYLLLHLQVRYWADEAAAASMLLSHTIFNKRPGLHVLHVASEMVPVAKVRCTTWCPLDGRFWQGRVQSVLHSSQLTVQCSLGAV